MTHDTTRQSTEQLIEPKRSAERHNSHGEEVLDPTPMQPPLGYKKTPSLSEQIQQQVRIAQLKMLEDMALEETEDEADDFEIGDDYEPLSKHENDHMPSLANLKKKAAEINAAIKKRNLELAIEANKDAIKKAGSPPPDRGNINNDERTDPAE